VLDARRYILSASRLLARHGRGELCDTSRWETLAAGVWAEMWAGVHTARALRRRSAGAAAESIGAARRRPLRIDCVLI
jgi:hypothetical protein